MIDGIFHRFFGCYKDFIPITIVKWYQIYYYNQRCNTHPKLNETTTRYIEAVNVYTSALDEYAKEMKSGN